MSFSLTGVRCAPAPNRPTLRHGRRILNALRLRSHDANIRDVGRARVVGPNCRAHASVLPGASEHVSQQDRSAAPGLQPLPPPPKSATLLDVLPYLSALSLSQKGYRARLLLALSCMAASKIAGVLSPYFFKRAVDCFQAGAVNGTIVVLLASGLCRMLNGVFKELQHPMFMPVSQAAARRLASNTFWHVLGLDSQFHLNRQTGRMSRILERGTRSIQMLFRAVVFMFLPTALELLLVCIALSRVFSPSVAVTVLVTTVAYMSWTVAYVERSAAARKKLNELDNKSSGKAVDALLNFETVTLFDNRNLEVGQYDTYLGRYQQAAVQTEQLSCLLNSGQAVILAVGMTAALCAATISSGTMVAGDLVLIQGLLLQLWAPLLFLGWFSRELRQALVDVEEFFNILKTTSALPDGNRELPPPPARASTLTAVPADPCQPNGNGCGNGNGVASTGRQLDHASPSGRGLSLALHDVKFGYHSDRLVLKGVSIDAAPGTSLAVVGPSGSGKSTLVKLMTRLYDVDSGSIRLDGIDVRELKLEALRSAVAVVPQDCVLLNDTIMNNIRYGRPEASDEEVQQAADLAQLSPALQRMPEGMQTVVGERGLKLSGGEKQRVAIARAFLREPRLLICDEATSALDTATEKGIMAALDSLAKGRTSVFVAHRLSTVRNCDKIIVMAAGQVVEEGTHDQLMAAGGMYAHMWQQQASERDEIPGLEQGMPVAA